MHAIIVGFFFLDSKTLIGFGDMDNVSAKTNAGFVSSKSFLHVSIMECTFLSENYRAHQAGLVLQ